MEQSDESESEEAFVWVSSSLSQITQGGHREKDDDNVDVLVLVIKGNIRP